MRQLFLAITLLLCASAHGYENSPEENMALMADNAGDKALLCQIFYAIVLEGMQRTSAHRGEQYEGSEALQSTMDALAQYAFGLYGLSREGEELVALTTAKYEWFTRDMVAELHGKITNISILANKYGVQCKSIAEDPAQLFIGLYGLTREQLDDIGE